MVQLLKSRLHIPASDSDTLISREHLLASMNRALTNDLILVCAPAGFGKSTFLAQWIGSAGIAPCTGWLSLENGDNDPLVFWSYVMAAFNTIAPGICDALLMRLQAGPVAAMEDIIISMINRIHAAARTFVMVLDDYHLITNQQIHDGVNFLIDHPVDHLTLVISTRKLPLYGLSRRRTTGGLMEITEDQLRFSRQETEAYIRRCTGSAPAPGTIEEIVSTTEGWVAALKLTLLARTGRNGSKLQSLSGTHRMVRDYLMEEVFSQLPEEIRHFCINVSFLDRFCAPLCRAVLEASDAGDHIHYMATHGLFLIVLDDDHHWYRFHHLFQDFLKGLFREESHDTRCRRHRAAALWFDRNFFFRQAFSHAMQSEQESLAVKILARHIARIYGEQGEQGFVDLFQDLSRSAILGEAVLVCYYFGIHVYQCEFEVLPAFKALLDRQWNTEDRQLLAGFDATFDAYHAFYRTGDLEVAIAKCDQALARIPREHGTIRRVMEFVQAICYRFSGDIQSALALTSSRAGDPLVMAALTAMNRASLELELGNLEQVRKLVGGHIAHMERMFGSDIPPICGLLYVYQGQLRMLENRLEEALHSFTKGVRAVEESGYTELTIISFSEYAMLLCHLGAFDRAHRAIDHAVSLARQSSYWLTDLFYPYKYRIWMAEGRYDLLDDWVGAVEDISCAPDSFFHTIETLTRVRYWIHRKMWNKVFMALDLLIGRDEQMARNGRLLECYLLKAKALYLTGETDRARDFVVKAFELSRSQGHVLMFLDVFEKGAPIYEDCHRRGEIPPHLKSQLILMEPVENNSVSHGRRAVQVHEFEETFNTREIDILKLFQKGCSNKEVADKLCLSVNTIRWYAGKIFAKLDVKRRGQAVSRAVELGLIASASVPDK